MKMITLREYETSGYGREIRINVEDIMRYEDCEYGVEIWFKSRTSSMLFFGKATGVDRLITEAQR